MSFDPPMGPERRFIDLSFAREHDGSVRITRTGDSTRVSWTISPEEWALIVAHVSAHQTSPLAPEQALRFHCGFP